ncbi:hypothetical protein PACTADRAFT_47840 [Pachysolen tannophilus NRRL Y-2460]|uniref:Assembly chaperone of RPL4 n=1 Tax=Pachysolen tannophilus NRRL Y-2460 TaxID=669874 RepID=A0A1E4U1Z7_PACTA|nr:hypothetical protein PACTADRAFT_47840 [Pachysolen tannophilus NRRL Y-2460]
MTSASELETLLLTSRALLSSHQPELALATLKPHADSYSLSVPFLQQYGETLLENSELEEAYDVLAQACEYDPQAAVGVEKFLYLGQIIGGRDGLNFLNVGLNKLLLDLETNSVNDALAEKKSLIKKLNQGIFAEIEIWMTDLCMEEEAEQQCNDLINKSLEFDNENPEAWSTLASIRISQQRNDDAITAVNSAWELFLQKKTALESASNNATGGEEEEEASAEYFELIQALLTLAKYAIELEMFEISLQIVANVQDINEKCLESYYLEGFVNYLIAKRIQNNIQSDSDVKIGEIYMDLPPLDLNRENDEESKTYIDDARLALSSGYKLLQIDSDEEEIDPEIKEMIQVLLKEVGGFTRKTRNENNVNEENWEEEIEMDD